MTFIHKLSSGVRVTATFQTEGEDIGILTMKNVPTEQCSDFPEFIEWRNTVVFPAVVNTIMNLTNE